MLLSFSTINTKVHPNYCHPPNGHPYKRTAEFFQNFANLFLSFGTSGAFNQNITYEKLFYKSLIKFSCKS